MILACLSQLELCDLQAKRTLALELSHFPDNLPHLRVLGMIDAEFARRDVEFTRERAKRPLDFRVPEHLNTQGDTSINGD